MAISPATVSSPVSPVGRKLTVGAVEIDNETKIQRRVEFDLYYIENWSTLFDLYILCRTPLALLKTERAYLTHMPVRRGVITLWVTLSENTD